MIPPLSMNRHLIQLFVALVLISQTILSSPSVSFAATQRLRRVDLIVSGGTVVTMDGGRRVIEDGAVAVERGRTAESVIEQYVSTVRPMHMQFVEPSKRYADVIIPEGGHNLVSIGLISGRIRERIAAAHRTKAEAAVSVRLGVEQGG